MWAYADNTVKVEFDGTEYELLTKDETYESEEARKWCLKYWNWHRKNYGKETTEKIVRDLFIFRCFQCQKPVSAAIIPKSDRNENGESVTFKRTSHFKCSVNNCYGGGKAAAATEEFNVITDKTEIPVTELRFPPAKEKETRQSMPKSEKSKNTKLNKKNRKEKKTSTSIAPICEQFYNYCINDLLRNKFISIPFISDEIDLSYNYLFVDLRNPDKNSGQKTGIYFGSPDYWIECKDCYVVILKNTANGIALFIRLTKSDSALNVIKGVEKGGLFFVLGKLSKLQGHTIITSDSDFWCHALKLPNNDTYFSTQGLTNTSEKLKSESQLGDDILKRLINLINKPKDEAQTSESIDNEEPPKAVNIKKESQSTTNTPSEVLIISKSIKPLSKWQKLGFSIRRWFDF
ncbi:hypothetical protein [Colwellia psychrerythraea]|uniref:Uncharacterized protein n=1 Tax=Colwellia psychrerythraea TaxID=28229 RepID=A0A099KYP8_COLPS|nr:hypothetical protein [Colwellia psychrerythraea]KGJ95869.1 hypothetical protein GAB14E_1781 [Colwellia psychrerythraea]